MNIVDTVFEMKDGKISENRKEAVTLIAYVV